MISDERLAEIRDVYIDDHEVIGELLTEVEWLRRGGNFEATVRLAGHRLKKQALIYLACCTFALFMWWACSQVLREPWALLASWALDAPGGYVGGAVYFWCADRWETRKTRCSG